MQLFLLTLVVLAVVIVLYRRLVAIDQGHFEVVRVATQRSLVASGAPIRTPAPAWSVGEEDTADGTGAARPEGASLGPRLTADQRPLPKGLLIAAPRRHVAPNAPTPKRGLPDGVVAVSLRYEDHGAPLFCASPARVSRAVGAVSTLPLQRTGHAAFDDALEVRSPAGFRLSEPVAAALLRLGVAWIRRADGYTTLALAHATAADVPTLIDLARRLASDPTEATPLAPPAHPPIPPRPPLTTTPFHLAVVVSVLGGLPLTALLTQHAAWLAPLFADLACGDGVPMTRLGGSLNRCANGEGLSAMAYLAVGFSVMTMLLLVGVLLGVYRHLRGRGAPR